MISMEMLGKIRRKLSLHQIAKRTGLSRNTIRKWVRAPEASQPAYQRGATFNKLSPFHETLEQALKADSFRAKHNRRSAKALFEQIKAEGYDGGYSQLTAFIRSWRGEQGKSLRAFVPLTFALGEAFQFDWSEEGLLIGGLFRRIQVSHMKLCASRAFWLVAYPSQGHEMLFDAHNIHGVSHFGSTVKVREASTAPIRAKVLRPISTGPDPSARTPHHTYAIRYIFSSSQPDAAPRRRRHALLRYERPCAQRMSWSSCQSCCL